MPYRRIGALFACVAIGCIVLITACTNSVDSPAAITERIRVSGSGTCMPLLRILTSAYPGDEVEFVFLPGLHSGGGIRGVENGDLEIGAVSRDLTEDEEALGLEYRQVSDDALAIAVHPSVTVDSLSSEQIQGIYDGTYTSWAQLGGGDLPIVVLDRSEDESAKIILRQYVIGDLDIAESAVNLFYEADMVSGLEGTPGSIGYFSLGLGVSEDLNVSYVALDGVAPTVPHVNDGSYRAIRPLGIVFGKSVDPGVREFIEWMQSDAAIRIMEDNGFARVGETGNAPANGE